MSEVKFDDYSQKVRTEFQNSCVKAMEMCGLKGEGYAKDKCPVDQGTLRLSITHTVAGDNPITCYIGSNIKYAPYVELGTGIYYPSGRKTPWVYKDIHGHFWTTRGNPAQPYLKPAVADHVNEYINMIKKCLS